MLFEELVTLVGRAPLFETGLLLAGDVNPEYLRRQLSEWVANGKLWQIRRGLYALAPPYQKTAPHPFDVANKMVNGSYVSLQAALGFYGMIPEYVMAVTSVTTGRPGEWENKVGSFIYRHIKPTLFYDYQRLEVTSGQWAFIAWPEKALMDLIYLQPGGDSTAFLRSLRLQNLEQFNLNKFKRIAEKSEKPKLRRAAASIPKVFSEDDETIIVL